MLRSGAQGQEFGTNSHSCGNGRLTEHWPTASCLASCCHSPCAAVRGAWATNFCSAPAPSHSQILYSTIPCQAIASPPTSRRPREPLKMFQVESRARNMTAIHRHTGCTLNTTGEPFTVTNKSTSCTGSSCLAQTVSWILVSVPGYDIIATCCITWAAISTAANQARSGRLKPIRLEAWWTDFSGSKKTFPGPEEGGQSVQFHQADVGHCTHRGMAPIQQDEPGCGCRHH